MKRFIPVLAVLAVVAGIVTSAAGAIAFDDADYFWPTGRVGESYFKQLLGRTDVGVPGASGNCDGGAKCTFTLASGAFPPGISMTPGGRVSGIPTQGGTYGFWLRLSGNFGGAPAEREFSITVTGANLTVDGKTLKPAMSGVPYTDGVTASGGSGGNAWSVASGQLPAGMSLNSSGGITGSPTATGGTQPYTWTLTGDVPGGLTFDQTQAVVSGAPTTAGPARVTFSVTDKNGFSKTLEVPLSVVARLAIAPKSVAKLKIGGSYVVRLAATGGIRPVKWTRIRGRLPRGIRFDGTLGRFVGKPKVAGTFSVIVRARDALGALSQRTVVLSIRR